VQLVTKGCGALILLALFGACGDHSKSSQAAPPREVDVLTLSPTPVRDTSEYLGSLISRQSVTLVPQVAGYVRQVLVRPGKQVEAGEVLLEVDARQESAALDSAQAQHVSAKSSRVLAERNLERTRSLYKEGLVSAQELERAQAALAEARATSQSTAAQVSQHRVELQYHEVKAPFAGTVGDVVVRVGDLVTATTPLTTVAQVGVLEASVAVPADRARGASVGMPLEILSPDGSVLLSCPVYFVAPQADARSQMVDVKAVFRNTVGLRPNEWVRARLVFGVSPALQVPALSVTRQSGQAFVFAVLEKDGVSGVTRRPIKLGPLGEQNYVVEDGLVAGDRIAVSAIQSLREGSTIIPRPLPGTSPQPSARQD
jgi:RND family efflux transporter MFP subunit